MKIDNLRRYVDLRDSLVREKKDLENRLVQINEALGEREHSAESSLPFTRGQATGTAFGRSKPHVRGGRGHRGGGLSLREAVLQLTNQRPMEKEEILSGVKQLGYKFSTNNPLNSLGVILYGKKPRFKNEGGRFSPAGAAVIAVARTNNGGTGGATTGKKRKKPPQLSAEARERIAAAQRARWAKVRARA